MITVDETTLNRKGDRRRLPDRRASQRFQFEQCGKLYLATISRFDDGTLAELFLDGQKAGSEIAEQATDSAVLVSLLLQHGVSPAEISHSVSGAVSTALRIAEAFYKGERGGDHAA